MDSRSKEVIDIYTVTVQGDGSEAQKWIHEPSECFSAPFDCQLCVCRDQGAALPAWVVPVMTVLLALSVGMNIWQGREIWQLWMKPERKGDTNNVQKGVKMKKLDSQGAEEQDSLAPSNNDQKV
ncbi:hypothetical protein MHYP_G00263450 [Metynnis hypsauchen]